MNKPIPNEELISGYLDGELTVDEQAAVERHLAENAEFRQLYEELKALRSRLQALPSQEPSADLTQFILARAELELMDQSGWPSLPPETTLAELQPKSPIVAGSLPKVSGHNDWRKLLIAAVSISAVVMLAFLAMPRNDEATNNVAKRDTPAEAGGDEKYKVAGKKSTFAEVDANRMADQGAALPATASREALGPENNAMKGEQYNLKGQAKNENRQGTAPRHYARKGPSGNVPADPARDSDPAALQMKEAQQFANQVDAMEIDGLEAKVFVTDLTGKAFVEKLAQYGISAIQDNSTELKRIKSSDYENAYVVETTKTQLDLVLRDDQTKPALLALRSARKAGGRIGNLSRSLKLAAPGGAPMPTDDLAAAAAGKKLSAKDRDNAADKLGEGKRSISPPLAKSKNRADQPTDGKRQPAKPLDSAAATRIAKTEAPAKKAPANQLTSRNATPAKSRARRDTRPGQFRATPEKAFSKDLAQKQKQMELAPKDGKTPPAPPQQLAKSNGNPQSFRRAGGGGFGGGGGGSAAGDARPAIVSRAQVFSLKSSSPVQPRAGKSGLNILRLERLQKVLPELETSKLQTLVQNMPKSLEGSRGGDFRQEMKKASNMTGEKVVVLFLVAKRQAGSAQAGAKPGAAAAVDLQPRAGDKAAKTKADEAARKSPKK